MVRAKAKKRRAEIEEDAEAIKEYEKKAFVPVKKAARQHHRDEISFKEVVAIMADEIEAIAEETNGKIDRMNAEGFYAMNIWRALTLKHDVVARERKVPIVKCREHK